MHVHPNTELLVLAQLILTHMGLESLAHQVALMFGENGEVISPEWSLQMDMAGGHSTVASMLLRTPVDISCIIWDSVSSPPEID